MQKIVIEGPDGIGKSRLLSAVSDAALRMGYRYLLDIRKLTVYLSDKFIITIARLVNSILIVYSYLIR